MDEVTAALVARVRLADDSFKARMLHEILQNENKSSQLNLQTEESAKSHEKREVNKATFVFNSFSTQKKS